MGRRLILAVLVFAVACGGCRARPKAPVPVAKQNELLAKPAIDLSHGIAGFPLETKQIPQKTVDFAFALHRGYAERLVSPRLIKLNVESGERANDFRHIFVDISGSQVKPDYVPKPPPKDTKAIGYIEAASLQYAADPLKYQNFAAGMRFAAKRAKLGILPAGDGTFGLSLVDCKEAHANLTLSLAGLRETLAKGVQAKQSVAFMVDKVDLDLASDNPRSLQADVLVYCRLFLFPARFHLTGRLDIDDAFNVHFSRLNAAGLDPTGKVVAGIVQTRLDKMNNRAARLLKMPDDRVRITELTMKLTENLTIDVDLAGSQ
jgi:hypothetical protein